MIRISNVKKSYKDLEVLHNISLNIEKGDIYSLIGRSGTGKSTLLRCINGLETYDSGKIIVNNVDINLLKGKSLREFRKEIGMVFQDFSLIERKSVFDNIALPMTCWGYSKKEINCKVNDLAMLVGIQDKLQDFAKNLSGGQKQRVAIARSLTLNPSILLCDEATSALDPKTTSEILDLLSKINKELGITIVIVTHQMSVVQRICNKMAILYDGHIVEEGYVKDIFFNKSEALTQLLSTSNSGYSSEDCLLEIFTLQNQEKLMSRLAIDLGKEFSIVKCTVEKYSNENLGDFTLKINNNDLKVFETYLKENKVKYKILNRGGVN